MSRRSWVALTLSAWVAVASSACASRPPVSSHRDRNCITDFRTGIDYFPDKSTLLDATNFARRCRDSYQVLTVKHPVVTGVANPADVVNQQLR